MRESGVLLPIFSLPSRYGIGALGEAAHSFINFLAASGQSYWQVLPVGMAGKGFSPYSAFSAFAGNTLFIDLDVLVAEGLLDEYELTAFNYGADAREVDYEKVLTSREALLHTAYRNAVEAGILWGGHYANFLNTQAFWLEEYSLFMAIKDKYSALPLDRWPDEVKMHEEQACEMLREELFDSINKHKFLQYKFFEQWADLRAHAACRGVKIIGDIPIYVCADSSECFSERQLFMMDEGCSFSQVAGVPPDAFSEEGQKWGNPLYNWQYHLDTNFSWWVERLRRAFKLYDVVRIDHFRGLESCYAIPLDAPAKEGVWVKSPGHELFAAVKAQLGQLNIIAEDLGILTDEVRDLLHASGYPGMKVLQFAFSTNFESDYLPHRCEEHSIMYTGTHDNTTTAAWLQTAPRDELAHAVHYLKLNEQEGFVDGFIRGALQSPCGLCIVPLHDYIGAGEERRINTPGVATDNWKVRFESHEFGAPLVHKIYNMTYEAGRI